MIIADGKRPTEEELAEPIEYDGHEFMVTYRNSAKIKENSLFGMETDLSAGLMKYSEDNVLGVGLFLMAGMDQLKGKSVSKWSRLALSTMAFPSRMALVISMSVLLTRFTTVARKSS
ncbi:MAG: hypothetical protein PVF74_09790 [Anaerolineales bacterium]|jgi:hypothetical protein